MKNIGYSFNGFTTARLKRFLKTGGQEYRFIEYTKNEYGELTAVESGYKDILGVLHTTSGYEINSTIQTANSKVRRSSSISILTSWESLSAGFSGGKELSPDMQVTIGETQYKIIKTSNLNDWGIVANIELEEIDEWKN